MCLTAIDFLGAETHSPIQMGSSGVTDIEEVYPASTLCLSHARPTPYRRHVARQDGHDWTRAPDREVRMRRNQERPNQTEATCVKLVDNRRQEGTR